MDGEPEDVDGELQARLERARPELDAIARAVMRASAARALFGASATVRIGRYELLREVGTGGGGSVFVARDPELDREIALKLIVASHPALRARALSEGQALARLSHPNVVPVFDVGIAEDRVYLVMELVRGESLRAYAERASVRDVCRAYLQAGEGLAAAHAAGLVHRDFKPDNAVIGSDGRVRVIDFGLAVTAARADDAPATTSRPEGTPRYMAPEQQAGDATAASDQYAFALSLREAVVRAGDEVPRWLDQIVRRATSEDPAARFASMEALLARLADDPRTRWRRRALWAAPVVLATAGFVLGRSGEPAPALAPCEGASALAPVWTAERSATTVAHVAGLGTPYATSEAPRIGAALDDYATQWIASHDAACVAARSEPSATLVDRRAACLARARAQLDATAEHLAKVDAGGLPSAMRALTELPDLARCADPDALIDDTPPPPAEVADEVAALANELARAQVGIEAASPDAVAQAEHTVARARALGYRPLLARALLAHGRALLALDQRDRADAPLAEAYTHAFAVGDHATAVEAFARAAWVRSMTSVEQARALAGLDVVTAIAERLGPRDRFAHALLHNNAGVVLLGAGQPARARERLTTALALAREVTGPGEVELAVVRTNLALVAHDDAERERLYAEAITALTARLGEDHPLTLDARLAAAFSTSDESTTRAALRPVCERYAQLHPEYRAMIVECASELTALALASGDVEAARASIAMTLSAAGEDVALDRVATARAYASWLAGDRRGALAALDAAAAGVAISRDASWVELLLVADLELARAVVTGTGTASAARHGARAVELLERAEAQHSLAVIQRRLAWARRLAP